MFRKYPTPIDLSDLAIQLRPGGGAEPGSARGVAGAGLWTVARIQAETGADLHSDVWERHPHGDEVLCVLAGAVRLQLRDQGPDPGATVTAGHSVVVPAGVCHRLDVGEPVDLLAITPRADTEHERRTEL